MKFILLIMLLIATNLSLASEEVKQPIKIKWVLAHEPIDLFKIAADSFIKEVTEKTQGKVSFELMSLAEYETKYNNNKKIHPNKFLAKIQDNSIEMSQTYTTSFGEISQDMYVLDLPFLFRDHSHAKNVLEGKIGEQLLSNLSPKNIRGLAFTYSGGYRILPGVKKISKVEDFKGLKVRTSGSPVADDTFKLLGAIPYPMSLDDIDTAFTDGKINEAESTYARYFPMGQNKVANIVNETNHSLFLTAIVMNEKFWMSLPEEYRIIMKQAAIHSARLERDYSIKASAEIKEKCIANGVEIVTLNKTEEAKMKVALEPVYKKYNPIFGKDLISNIIAQ